jgi:hypothetical protein
VRVWALVAVLGLYSCDHGLEAEAGGETGIAGRLHFVGQWPAEVGQVAVVVYREAPTSLAGFFSINGWDTEVEIGADSYDYFVPLNGDGLYQWIIVAWREEDAFWDFTSLLGCYHLPDAERPTPVEVGPGEVVRDINIEVDFAALQRETDPGTALCERVLPAELFAELGG